MLSFVEYIWLDGAKPTQNLRSKTRVLDFQNKRPVLSDLPVWSYDGSSTYQASGSFSDLILKPVHLTNDPIRGEGHYLVLCEVFSPDGSALETNNRAKLREEMQQSPSNEEAWMGFEQEYTLYDSESKLPFRWPSKGEPPKQGPYYCSVGVDRAWGRNLVEAHAGACVMANLAFYGINAEVMPAQWEFQIGYRGISNESVDPLSISDHLWLARWMLMRIGEEMGISINWTCKPMEGDWNGAGLHTNFSTQAMRNTDSGWEAIGSLLNALSQNHDAHIAEYGAGLDKRLTGLHETCGISEFKAGEHDRGASIRIPAHVTKERCGYIEDRRPGANADPYRISTRILKTLHEIK